ncbi:MAG: TonB-dependent receptor [Flavobacteriaceae bacterium]|nr:TonB-dependent receptor [Flavobacteriaceae bacterium]
MKKQFTVFLIMCFSIISFAQHDHNAIYTIEGIVSNDGTPIAFATVSIKGTSNGAACDENGAYLLKSTHGEFTIIAQAVGYKNSEKTIDLDNNTNLNFDLKEDISSLDQVVVTGTRTYKKRTNSAVIVNVINSQTLENVQACTLSEGLKFQTGLRVETNCQTCNYTQLRMNGLAGGYSQILINGRPIFSPLTGLYGMEQIPTNMIDRIEVVRGGGSALYGSSAIGGTVNVITKIPRKNNYEIGFTHQNFKGTPENILAGNVTAISKDKNTGATFFLNNRQRSAYDANGDNFSELPQLKNLSFGTNLFFLPTENQKLEVSLSKLNEYRYGGEMVEGAAHFALQSEERTHDVFMGNLDYQINFNEDKSSFIIYGATQHTERVHYTGIVPDKGGDINPETGLTDYENHLVDPPYGTSVNLTMQGGMQLNHKLEEFIGGNNVLTFGTEYIYDDVFDNIPAYNNYTIDQITENYAAFFQSDWEISPKVNFLSGVRLDKHNLVDNIIASPRVSFLYKPFGKAQFRATWGTGFRAPQAFDTDLHIAFAGGGVSRISLAENLKEERSNSYSASFNYDKGNEHFIAGFTLEGFYTHLKDAFTQVHIGDDQFGERFEKQNGDGATVKGVTFEARANFDKVVQIEAGFTLQSSLFTTAVDNFDNLAPKKEFLRTPNDYGYATFSYTPTKRFNTSLNLVYTGKMELMHIIPDPSDSDETIGVYSKSSPFTELGFKSSYIFNLKKTGADLQVFGGVKNIFDEYQTDFDSGKNRDSNYVYGPGVPRTFFIGLKIGTGL